MNKIAGYFYKGIGKVVDFFLMLLIAIVNILVEVFSSIKHAFGLLISFGGCLFLVFMFNPFLWALIFSPPLITLIALAILVPFIGKIAVSYLKYAHYVTTEFFYDRADHYLLGKNYAFDDFSDYSRRYRVKEEEKRRREEEERRKKQEEEWNRRFQNFGGSTFTWTFGDFDDLFEQMNNGTFNQGQYQGNYRGYQQQSPYQNMGMSFKKQYEDACDILGVSYGSDKYEIKLAYRKKAKEYHPDINKASNAKEMFQKVNNAYEFLNDSNIERYRQMSKNM